MFTAIIASIVAALIVVIIIAVFFAVRYRRQSQSAASSKKTTVRSIKTVGVKSSLEKDIGVQQPRATDRQASGKVADALTDRFVALGVFAVAIFGALGVKLFGMQVLSGSGYSEKANENARTTVKTPAPRGGIFDANGVELVKNRSSLTVLADPEVADDRDVVSRLSAVLGIPQSIVRQRIQDSSAGAQSQRIVEKDVRLRDVAFISEHADAFPGVTVQTRTVRDYPYGALASHAVGYTGTISNEELQTIPEGRTIEMGDEVGKSGIEESYDSILSGDHGIREIIADADGNIREVISETQPTKGSDIYTTLIAPAQYVAEQELASCIAPTGELGSGKGTGGAVVAMDVTNGDIVVMANYPTFSPETFVGGIKQDIWDMYNTAESKYPLFNRTVAGLYPAASTFKAFTGMAGLTYGFADEKKEWNCGGWWDGFGSGDWQACWLTSGHGPLDLRHGVIQSCDVVFYEIAKDFFTEAWSKNKISTNAMMDEIKKYNLGKASGIDISGEVDGVIPTPEWKAEFFRDTPEEASWRGGDQTNMVIGQGYVRITPIQLCVAYGAIASGKLWKPHLLKEVRNAQGQVVSTFKPEVVGTPDIDPKVLEFMRDALHGVAQENPSVSKVMSEYGIDAGAKTGTAEVAGYTDYSLFACYAPWDNPKYVVATVIEEGGNTSEALPVGAAVLNALLEYDKGELTTVGRVAASTGKVVEGGFKGGSGSRQD